MDIPLKLEAPWEQVKEMLKEVNPELTDDDLMYDTKQANILLETLSRKMNRSPEEIRTWIESVSHNKGKAS
jgi:hypothetical protein